MAIHVFQEDHAGSEFQVWTDCESGEHKSGRCLASASDPIVALRLAKTELERDIVGISAALMGPAVPVLPSVRKMAQKLTEKLSDQGKIIEGGWVAFEYITLKGSSEIQRSQMRKAFFCGAQHLFASIIQTLDAGTEPTDKDLDRMNKIHKELERFTLELKPRG